MTLLEGCDLHVRFGDSWALRGATLEVDPGESLAVVGPSGSGKTSLLQCLGGTLQPDRGQVIFDRTDVTKLGQAQRSRLRLASFGMVLQFGELIPELSLVENVALPSWVLGTPRQDAQTLALRALDEFGIVDLGDRFPSDVSGGERQRAAVARALAHDPDVVLADEPTGALDTTNGRAVLTALHRAAQERGASVVVVTHDPDVARTCDRIVRFVDGRVCARQHS